MFVVLAFKKYVLLHKVFSKRTSPVLCARDMMFASEVIIQVTGSMMSWCRSYKTLQRWFFSRDAARLVTDHLPFVCRVRRDHWRHLSMIYFPKHKSQRILQTSFRISTRNLWLHSAASHFVLHWQALYSHGTDVHCNANSVLILLSWHMRFMRHTTKPSRTD